MTLTIRLLMLVAVVFFAANGAAGSLSFRSEIAYHALRETLYPFDADSVQRPTDIRYDADSVARRSLYDRLTYEKFAGQDFGCRLFIRYRFVLRPDGVCLLKDRPPEQRSAAYLGGPFLFADVVAFLRTRAAGGPPPGVAAGDVVGPAAAGYWTADAKVLIDVVGDCRQPETVPLLIDLLRDEALCFEAARALAQFGPDAAPAVPALTARLERLEPGGSSRGATIAAVALSAIGRDAHAALLRIVNDPADDRRTDALWALAASFDRPDYRPLMPFLIGVLKDVPAFGGGGTTRPAVAPAAALAALRAAGPDAVAALPALVHGLHAWMLNDVRSAAIEAIAAMGPEGLPALQAAMVAETMYPEEGSQCAGLLLAAGDAGVATILRAYGAEPERALAAVAAALSGIDDRVTYRRARPIVYLCLGAGWSCVREEALRAVVRNESAERAVEVCLAQLRRDDVEMRAVALVELKTMVEQKKVSALPDRPIRAALRDPDERVRQRARDLLDQMNGPGGGPSMLI